MSGIRHNSSWQTAHIARLSKAYNDVSAKTSNFAAEYATKDHVTELIETSGFITEEDAMVLIEQAQIEPIVGDAYLTKNEASSTYSTIGALSSSVSTINAKFNDYATKDYVAEELAKIPSSGGDATKAYIDEQIASHNHNGLYYTKQEVDTKISEIPSSEITSDLTLNTLTVSNTTNLNGTVTFDSGIISSNDVSVSGAVTANNISITENAVITGNLTVDGTIYDKSMKNDGGGDVEVLTPYATTEYVDKKIEDSDFAPKAHVHDEYHAKVEMIDASITLTYIEHAYNWIKVQANKSILNTRVTLNCWNAFKTGVITGFGSAIIDKNGNVSRNYIGSTYGDGSTYEDSTFTLYLKADGRNPESSLYTGGNPINGYQVYRLPEQFALKDHTHDAIYYTKAEVDSKIAALEAAIQSLKNPA